MHNNKTQNIRKLHPTPIVPECKYWILDTDVGCDDAQAIMCMLLMAKKYDKVLLGITCVNGNAYVKDVVINCLLVLAQCGAKVPVYAGAAQTLVCPDVKDCYFGKDAFGDKQLDYIKDLSDKIDFSLLQKKHAAEFICEAAKEHANDIGIIMIGPMTNLALAYYIDPEIANYIQKVSMMGGNFTALGLQRFFASEFNFYIDAVAARVVIKKFRNIYMTTIDLVFQSYSQEISKTFTMDNTPKAKMIKDIFAIITKNGEQPLLCDPLAVFGAIETQRHVKSVYEVKVEVVLSGLRTKGYLAIDWLADTQCCGKEKHIGDGVVRILGEINGKIVYKEILEAYE